jgi:hypothetical protein
VTEKRCDAWSVPSAQAVCVTTNGTLKKDGRGVMGRGIALQAERKFKDVDRALGRAINHNGNCVQVLLTAREPDGREYAVVAFPVKHQWWERADLDLIARSAQQLVSLADQRQWTRVVLPRPGCGNGHLTWDEVEPILRPLLDDRFLVVTQ